jgi:hypothetical protein
MYNLCLMFLFSCGFKGPLYIKKDINSKESQDIIFEIG